MGSGWRYAESGHKAAARVQLQSGVIDGGASGPAATTVGGNRPHERSATVSDQYFQVRLLCAIDFSLVFD